MPDEPQMATKISDNMSFDDAWQAARDEVGAGGYFVWNNEPYSTYTKEEWNQLDDESQTEFTQQVDTMYQDSEGFEEVTAQPIVIYDEAPVSDIVTDDMTFDDAFALARQELGPGGVFTWQGNTYNTYYKDEWDQMEGNDQDQFMTSASHVQVDESQDYQTLSQSKVEYVAEAEVVVDNTDAEIFIGEEVVTLNDGSQVHVGYFTSNGENITKLDVDFDNNYDYVVDQETNSLIGLNGNQDINMNTVAPQDEQVADNPAVMTENVVIDGANGILTTYADGSQMAELDMDGNGMYDTKLTLDTTGKMQVYDYDGNLLHEEQLEPVQEVAYKSDEPIEDETMYAEADVDYIDEQLEGDFGDDFDDNADVSGWMEDDLA